MSRGTPAAAGGGPAAAGPAPAAGIVVRRAGPADVAAVGAVTAAAYLADALLAQDHEYLHELRDAGRRAEQATVLVAVEQERVLGTITLAAAGTPYAEVATAGEQELRMLAVDPAARGRGVGEMLLREAIRAGLSAGATRVILSTMPAMRTAQRMYDRLGLRRAPERDWTVDQETMLVYVAVATEGPR